MYPWIHVIAIFLLLEVTPVKPFADWMTKDFCSRSLKVGEIIMNEEVIQSVERTVKVFLENGDEVPSGSKYTKGQKLIVSVDNTRGQYVYEISGPASFVDGGCNGRRIANEEEADVEIANEEPTKEISIIAAWASGHSQVKVSKPFRLLPPHQETKAQQDLPPVAPPKAAPTVTPEKVNPHHKSNDFDIGQSFLIKKIPPRNASLVEVQNTTNVSNKIGNLRANPDHVKSTAKTKLSQNTIDSMKKNYKRRIINREKSLGDPSGGHDNSMKRESHYAKMQQRHHLENDKMTVISDLLNAVDTNNLSTFQIICICSAVVLLMFVCCLFAKRRYTITRISRNLLGRRSGKD